MLFVPPSLPAPPPASRSRFVPSCSPRRTTSPRWSRGTGMGAGVRLPASLSATPEPPPSSESPPSTDAAVPPAESVVVPGTPCFTRNILSSPMPVSHREVYLDAITQSVSSYLSDVLAAGLKSESGSGSRTVAQVNLLVPQLNPSLDVYDRRFLLQLTWAVVRATVTAHRLTTRVMVQGRRKFGAIPLSVSGLRRQLDADLDLSAGDFGDRIATSDLENLSEIEATDEAIVVVSPTNAVSIPIINSIIELVNHVPTSVPVILINPRLDDVPSPASVMSVSGRNVRLDFLRSIRHVFALRLLYDPGTSYPLRGVVFSDYTSEHGEWKVYRSLNVDKDYKLILQAESPPSGSDIMDAFKRDAFLTEKEAFMEGDQTTSSLAQVLLKPQFLLAIIIVALAVSFPYLYPIVSKYLD